MCKVTIFTAAYNRAHLLGQIYAALQRQKCYDFEWLVIDDGSTDDTEKLFAQWTAEDNLFPIRYYRQENQGLIRTMNRGIELARGTFFSKIDSDDYVSDDYMECMVKWLESIDQEKDIYAVSGVKIDHQGNPLKGKWPNIPEHPGYIDATDLERRNYDLDADMSEAWRTEILRQYEFPVWPGEKFAPEQIGFFQIARDGWKIRWFNHPVCICEYQQGGLTLGASSLEKHNPMGYAMMYNQNILLYPGFKNKLRNAMQMTALCSCAGHLEYLKQTNSKLATLLSFPLGLVLGIRRKHQFAKIR